MRKIRIRNHLFPLGRLIALLATTAGFLSLLTFVIIAIASRVLPKDVPESTTAEVETSISIPVIAETSDPATPTMSNESEKSSVDTLQSKRGCTARDPLAGLTKSSLPQLRRLNEYQALCDSFVTDRVMYFIGFPSSDAQARSLASWTATKLKEFHAKGVTPIVIMEPTNGSGGKVRLTDIATGRYDAKLSSFFDTLAKQGVTEESIGIWVPYPEINLPEWDARGFSPTDLPLMINRFSNISRKRYPNIHLSILLNASTYSPSDTSYAHGTYADFGPYINDIEPGSVQSFGLQGFPWKPKNGDRDRWSVNPAEFLHVSQAESAARRLGVGSIWINTGTFAGMYRGKSHITATITERASILGGILEEATSLKASGFEVLVNIFAENKILSDEEVDWSFGNLSDPKNPDRALLSDFITKADSRGIGLSFFDL